MTNKIIEAKTKKEAFDIIKNLYYGELREYELVDVLYGVEIKGLSVEEVVDTYGQLFYEIEGDKTIRMSRDDLLEGKCKADLGWKLWE
jgi:hypothetical protein